MAAPSYVSSEVAHGAVVSAITASDFSLSGGSNRKVFASIHTEDAAASGDVPCTGITFNAVAMTKVDEVYPTANQRSVGLWYMDEASLPSTGTYDVVASLTGDVSRVALIITELTGAKSDIDTSQTQITTSNTSTVEITPVDNESMIIVVGVHAVNGTTATPETSDYTAIERQEFSFPTGAENAAAYMSTGTLETAGQVTAAINWSGAGAPVGIIAAAFGPAAGGLSIPIAMSYYKQQ